MQNNPIAYNSAYLSINLLDELDYCFGGYGKPNVEFIFSLNTFVESFIGSSEFYTSLDELNHLHLTAPALFPKGRPILNLVVREGGLKFVNGVVNASKKDIYRGDNLLRTKQEAQQDFIIAYGNKIQKQYFLRSDINKSTDKIPLITSRYEEDHLIVSEVQSTSEELVSNLIGVANSSCIQTTLPIHLFNKQVNSLSRSPYSIQSLQKVAQLYNTQVSDLQTSLGYRFLPIPPFANILLSQAISVSDIPSKLSQLRADFQQLREQFVELEKTIAESESIKEQNDAYRKFTSFWCAFNRKYIDKHSRLFYGHLDLGKGANIDKAADTTVDGGSIINAAKDLNTGKIIGNIITKAYSWHKDRKAISRFKGLTNIWELFQNSKSITQQLGHFERLFSISFSTAEINRVHDYIKERLTDLRNEAIK